MGLSELTIQAFNAQELSELDVVFFALPHGVSSSFVPQLEVAGAKHIVDLARDFRHAEGWVYGQPEWQEDALDQAKRVAAPGCFATAIELAVAPLVAVGAVGGPISVAATTGSTGSGAHPKQATHHPARFANIKAYKILSHQHVPEIDRLFELIRPPGSKTPQVNFVPISAPVDRGIFATCFIPLSRDIDVAELYANTYANRPLVRVRDSSPELRFVRGTGFCDIAVTQQGDTAVVLSAIDNLGRGAAAQGVQAMNHMFGLNETAGLLSAPLVA
jgi:N-acetyl-gamma-glutamyl-phosphate reductase